MLLNANWSAWHRSLDPRLQSAIVERGCMGRCRADVREVPRRVPVLRLLLRQEAGQSDDLGVDVLAPDRPSLAGVHRGHLCLVRRW